MLEKGKMKVNFTYKDGVHDGELNIFDGSKFDSKDVIIYLLIEMGYDAKWIADSFLGFTEDSVKAFQRTAGLVADGIVGRKTWDELYRAYDGVTNTVLIPDINILSYPGKEIGR